MRGVVGKVKEERTIVFLGYLRDILTGLIRKRVSAVKVVIGFNSLVITRHRAPVAGFKIIKCPGKAAVEMFKTSLAWLGFLVVGSQVPFSSHQGVVTGSL